MPFKPGQSGNPAGKKPGTRHKATLAAQAILDGEGEALTRKAVELALDGHPIALRLCLERLIPPRKDRPVTLALPKVEGAGDLPAALGAVLEAVACGELTPAEGRDLAGLVEALRKGLELADIEARLTALEEAQGKP
ncbi:MAG: hypothetical protein FJ128_03775 [Deltaproteobacteria bacterium]|nr:hypothetical protein [Deltaproteobacteria bacterium]